MGAKVVITLKIMPESPDTDLEALHSKVLEKIAAWAGEGDTRKEIEPVAFGLKALKVTFVSEEDQGASDDLEAEIAELDGVQSCECIGSTRAVG